MYLLFAFLLILLNAQCIHAETKLPQSACEKNMGASFSREIKMQVCKGTENVGPGNCAMTAKGLHLSTEDLLHLCQGAANEMPAKCMRSLSAKNRREHGMQLCKSAETSLNQDCFQDLMSSPFRGVHKIEAEEATEFCSVIYDEGALSCMKAIVEVGLGKAMPAKLGLADETCRQSSLYVYPAGTTHDATTGKPLSMQETRSLGSHLWDTLLFWRGRRHSTRGFYEDGWSKRLSILACLQELKHTFSGRASKDDKFGAKETIIFCMHSSTRTMSPDSFLPENLFFDERLNTLEQSRRDQEPEYFRNYLSECAIRMGHVYEGAKGEGKRLFSPEQRLRACEGVDCLNGPYNCVKALNDDPLYRKELSHEQLLRVCQGAGGIDMESEFQIRKDARREEFRLKKLRYGTAREKRWAKNAKRNSYINAYNRMGLGPVLCFGESKFIGMSTEQRIELCQGAEGPGPAQCYGRATTAARFATHADMLNLCVGAMSTDPADCVGSAPHYLKLPEKLHLCTGAPVDRGSDASKCLKLVESSARLLKDAPRKGLGSFASPQQNEADATSRALLLHMCSFDGSKNPVASGECLRSAPRTLSHDSVVRTCTNTSNADLFSRVALCQRLLPRDWSLQEAASLCDYDERTDLVGDALDIEVDAAIEKEAAEELLSEQGGLGEEKQSRKIDPKLTQEPSPEEVKEITSAVVRCALEMNGLQTYRAAGVGRDGSPDPKASASIGSWTRAEASILCRKEKSGDAIRRCAQMVKASSSSSPTVNAQFVTPGVITKVCHEAAKTASMAVAAAIEAASKFPKHARAYIEKDIGIATEKAGLCLSRLTQEASSRYFGAGVAEQICTVRDPNHVLNCLGNSLQVGSADVSACINQPRKIERAQFAKIQAVDGAPFATAGTRFSITFDLVDQFGMSFYDGNNLAALGGNSAVSSRPINDATNQVEGVGCSGDNKDTEGFLVNISINEDNEQGAVIWGSRSNTTACGSITFNNLIITQAGSVTLKLVGMLPAYGVSPTENTHRDVRVLSIASLNVKPNPETGGEASGRCLFLFREGVCDSSDMHLRTKGSDDDAQVWVGSYTRNYIPMHRSNYLRFLTCTSTYDHWHVDWHSNSHGFWADYRTGIDAIWTGFELPRDEMSFTRVLGLPSGIITEAARDAETTLKKWTAEAKEEAAKKLAEALAAAEAAAKAKKEAEAKAREESEIKTGEETIAEGKEENDPKETIANMKVREGEMLRRRSISDERDEEKKKAKYVKKLASATSKRIRRAYYRKSMQWHPDKWVGMSIYSMIVQSAFEVVTQANEKLQEALEWELASVYDTSETETDRSEEEKEEVVIAIPPEEVYE